MRKFFSRYGYSAVKLFVTQFALGLFGAMLTSSTLEENVLAIVVGIFAVAFYLFLIYMNVWDIGAKDKISVDCGKLESNPWRGVLIALIANIPNLILATVYMIVRLAAPMNDAVSAFIRMLAFLIEGMYYGLLAAITLGTRTVEVDGEMMTEGIPLFEYWWPFFVIVIPALIVLGLAYYLGTRNAHFSKLMETEYPESDREPRRKWFSKK